jgi:hypothetical protein
MLAIHFVTFNEPRAMPFQASNEDAKSHYPAYAQSSLVGQPVWTYLLPYSLLITEKKRDWQMHAWMKELRRKLLFLVRNP